MRVLFFGTYDERMHPRVRALREGFELGGHDVAQVNRPLGMPTEARVQLARQPWRAPALLLRLLRSWWWLWRQGGSRRADVVVVGYLGHFDVHLARRRFRRSILVLDHMVSLGDTVRDRGLGERSAVARLLTRVDRAALRTADVVVVDTPEQAAAIVDLQAPRRVCVVPVAPPSAWFEVVPAPDPAPDDAVRVVFFGLYTPLQGAPTIGAALGLLRQEEHLHVTMIGKGQDLARTKELAEIDGPISWVDWVDWVDTRALPDVVGAHHVCLGIFGVTAKAGRVVPNKVLQGAAAGCALITSDTAVQRAALGDAALYVPAGSAGALADALRSVVADRGALGSLRTEAREWARSHGTPTATIAPLLDVLQTLLPSAGGVA